MKLFITLICLLTASLYADDPVNPITKDLPRRADTKQIIQNELTMLDTLIGITEQNLKTQKELRKEVEEYQKLQANYLNNTTNTELLFRVAKSANKISTQIDETHLTQSFNPEFLKELKIFAQVAKKRGIPKPE